MDPAMGKVGGSQGNNRYSYVLNNPIRLVDPDGRDALVTWVEKTPPHLILDIIDPESGEVRATWSFGPKSAVMGALSWGMAPMSVPGHQTPDINTYLLKHTKELHFLNIPTSREEDDKLVKIILARIARNEKYNTKQNNCAQTTCSILSEGLGFSPAEFVGNSVFLPSDAFRILLRLVKTREKQRKEKEKEEQRKQRIGDWFHRIDDHAGEIDR